MRGDAGRGPTQRKVLDYLKTVDHSTIAETAFEIDASYGIVSRALIQLRARHLVETMPDPDDGRCILLKITSKGEQW